MHTYKDTERKKEKGVRKIEGRRKKKRKTERK